MAPGYPSFSLGPDSPSDSRAHSSVAQHCRNDVPILPSVPGALGWTLGFKLNSSHVIFTHLASLLVTL